MTTLKSALTSVGWQSLEINTSSVQPPPRRMGREIVFFTTGTAEDPTRFYVSTYRFTEPSGLQRQALGFLPFAGAKGFDNQIIITSVSRSLAGNLHVQTSGAHDLNVGDYVIINGTSNPDLNEAWDSNGSTYDIQTGAIITSSPTTSSFLIDSIVSSPTSVGVGGNVIATYNWGAMRAGAIEGINLALTSSYDLYMYYDQYRFCGIVSQSNTMQSFYVGETARDHVPIKHSGRAYSTSFINSGSVVVSLNKDVQLRTGQKVWLIHTSGSSGTGSVERVTVTSRPSSSSFGCVLSGTYPSGSLIGEDPLPCMALGRRGFSDALSSLQGRDVRFIFHVNGQRTVDVDFDASSLDSMNAVADVGLLESSVDPDAMNYIVGRYIFMQKPNTRGVAQGVRGRLVGLVAFAIGPQTNGDLIRTGQSGSSEYKVFPSQSIGSYCVGIGPGAF